LDEKLSPGQKRRAKEKLSKVGWAKTAQPSSRSLYARPLLGRFTKANQAAKAKPSEHRGPAGVYFGANSVASALLLLSGRDPAENHTYSKPKLSSLNSKADISTLRRIGHFYFALTTRVFSNAR